jgi:hypothetical protein
MQNHGYLAEIAIPTIKSSSETLVVVEFKTIAALLPPEEPGKASAMIIV